MDFRVLKLDRVIAGGPASQAGSGRCYAVPVTLDEARDPPASAYDHAGLARP